MYEDYNFSKTTEYVTDLVNLTDTVDCSSKNVNNSQVQIDEATGMRIVERGPKRHKNTTSGHQVGFGTVILLLFGAVFVVSGIGMIIGGMVSLIGGDAEAFFALLFSGVFMTPFGLVPGLIAFYSIKKNKKNNDILQNGYMAKLPISSIVFTNSYMNEIEGYKIEVVNPTRKKGFMHRYCSDTIYNYDIEWLKEGDLMPIYVDKIDPTCFYMDFEGAVFDAKRKRNEEEMKNVQQ